MSKLGCVVSKLVCVVSKLGLQVCCSAFPSPSAYVQHLSLICQHRPYTCFLCSLSTFGVGGGRRDGECGLAQLPCGCPSGSTNTTAQTNKHHFFFPPTSGARDHAIRPLAPPLHTCSLIGTAFGTAFGLLRAARMCHGTQRALIQTTRETERRLRA